MTTPKLIDNFNPRADLRAHAYYKVWTMEQHHLEDLEQIMPWYNRRIAQPDGGGINQESLERLAVQVIGRVMDLRKKTLAQHPEYYSGGHSKIAALYDAIDALGADGQKDGAKIFDAIRPLIKRQTDDRPNPLAARQQKPAP